MKREIFLGGMILILFLIIYSLSFATSESQKVSIESSIYQDAKINGSVEVVIKIKNDSLGERNNLIKKIGEKKISFSNDELIYAEVNSLDLDELQSNPSIESLSPERVFHLDLQDSVPLINASVSQKIIFEGLNLTGQGETVCIIDSGVNYTHSDLGGCYGNNSVSSNCTIIGGYDFINGDFDPMDTLGHGTHVSGIVAASGGIMGVSPGVKIVSLKVCNTAEDCGESYIQNAINWCINNATKFNITVISMSLGSDTLYSNYCNDQFLANPINNAITNNISVVVATGNDYNATAIASPGCIQNVTRAGSTTKADVISDFSNGWGLGLLLAPGSLINSTWINGAYQLNSGTSMATPHISAAIAILNQYLKQNNRIMTPLEINSVLNSSGKTIYDSRNGYNFSRIDVYSALNSIDIESPNVTLVSPTNNLASTNQTQNFTCNSTDLFLNNVTLKLWNSTELYYNETKNVSGQSNSSEFNLTPLPFEDYSWNCFSSDMKGNVGSNSQNYSLTISEYILALFPSNNTYTNSNKTFTCNSSYNSNEQLSNITFSFYNSTNDLVYNLTENISGSSNSTNFNRNFTYEGNYTWDCSFYTNASTKVDSGNYTLYYDLTSPNLTLTSPENSTSLTGTQTIEFDYNVTDNLGINNCSFILNNLTVETNSTLTSEENSFSRSISPGIYNWSINCTDNAGNFNQSETRFLTVNSPPVVSSGGGGGGSSSSSVKPVVNPQDIIQGYPILIKEHYSQNFKLSNSDSHMVFVNKIINDTAEITIRSEPITFVLKVNESKDLNLTSPDYYDLNVRLNNINNGIINLTIKEVHISKRVFHLFNETNSTTDSPETNQENSMKTSLEEIYFSAILTFLGLGFILVHFLRNRNSKKNNVKNKKSQNKKKKEKFNN